MTRAAPAGYTRARRRRRRSLGPKSTVAIAQSLQFTVFLYPLGGR